MPQVLDVVQLAPRAAEHCGFKFGQVTQINDDGSVFVTGKIGDGGEWYIGPKDHLPVINNPPLSGRKKQSLAESR